MKITNQLTILLILFIGSILRFYNYVEIPFTHDEFSALFRLNFDSFSELIEKGVKVDGHPAGVHVFLYYWTKVFGSSEWIVKLPFTIFGIVSIWIIYLIGRKWFNETVGLISAAFIASIQFTVIYSQIARPYISGMFFSLIMVYYWTLIIKTPKKNFFKNICLFVLASTLCAYNHHFSLLFAGIVGLSGLFMIQKKYMLKYIISGIAIFTLYIPHLSIFFYQLNIGGIGGIDGWLGKPTNYFIIKYLWYILNFSTLSILMTLSIILYGLKKNNLKFKDLNKYILFFIWFILPFLIGFYYSKYINPVLQFSILIFCLPYLFFLLFGHFKLQSPKVNLLIITIIMGVNIFSLIFERQHYKLFYHSVYKEILVDYNEANENQENTLFIVDSHDKISKYFSKRINIATNYINFDTFKSEANFIEFLEKNNHFSNIYFGCLSSNAASTIPIIQEYYPKLKWQRNYVGGSSYLFNKEKTESKIIANLDFENQSHDFWTNVDFSKITKSISSMGKRAYMLDEKTEWGPKFSVNFNTLALNRNDFIDISLRVKYKNKIDPSAILVATLGAPNENIYWQGTVFNKFIKPFETNKKWYTIHHSIKLSDIYLNYNNINLNIYVWNKEQESFLIDDFKIKTRIGNPIIYGLVEDI